MRAAVIAGAAGTPVGRYMEALKTVAVCDLTAHGRTDPNSPQGLEEPTVFSDQGHNFTREH